MTSLGETLRRARLGRNLELNRIAEELKISASMLKAIEEERFDKLPGGVFARSFVRQYARLLEVDEHEIEEELTRVLDPPQAPVAAHTGHVPAHEIPLPRVSGWQAVGDPADRWWSSAWALALVVVVMLACAGAYAWWQRVRHPVVAHQVSPATSTPTPVPAAAPPAPPPAAAPTAAASAPTASTPPVPQASDADKVPAVPEVVAESAETKPAEAGAIPPVPEANPNAPVRVEVTALHPTWISVRTDGQYLFSGTLEANQSRTVGGNRNVWMKVGNAAGVEIRLNGSPIGPLGADGMVRTLQFTSGGFQIVPPEAPKPAPPTDPPNPL